MPRMSAATRAAAVPMIHRSFERRRRASNRGWPDAAASRVAVEAIEADPVFSMDVRGLNRFGRTLHLIVMANELRGGRGAYRLAHGGFARRGYCFGPPRWDLSRPDSAAKRRIFTDILAASAAAGGSEGLSEAVRRRIGDAIGQPERDSSVAEHEDTIAAALSGGYGRARIAAMHRDSLDRAEMRVRRLERIASPLAKPFLSDRAGALCVADFTIALGAQGATSALERFLRGERVTLTGGPQRLARPLDGQTWMAFVGATRPFCTTLEGAVEMRRRMINIAGCVGRLDWRPAIEAKADAIRLALGRRRTCA